MNQPDVSDAAERREIVASLNGYKDEAKAARMGGDNPRDDKWKENLDLYWNRHNFAGKASWQAKETMPEVPGFVDRFAGALKEALMSTTGDFYSIVDPKDTEGDLAEAVKRMLNLWLDQSGENQNGQIMPFSTVFEDQMKLGALMATSSLTTWKEDIPGGRVSIEAVDPRNVWMDPTKRNLYRLREFEIDRHELLALPDAKDSKGNPLYNLDEVELLVQKMTMDQVRQREELTGGGSQITSPRSPVTLTEYIATVLGSDGKKTYDKALFVVANNQFLLRGPEPNPFWHKNDWLTFSPLVTVPLSVYGRSYMEDFGSVARTFTNLTNVLLDATYVSSMNAFAVVPGMLANPGQMAGGVSPLKAFLLEDGYDPKDFASKLELGTLSPDALKMWSALKSELTEAAQINEVGMGQFAPKGRTSAAEVLTTQQSSNAMVRAVAQTVEQRWLNLVLDLVWKTGLQHMRKDDKALAAAAGPEMYAALYQRRRELVTRPMTFQARGLSEMIQRAATLKSILGVFQIIGSNQALAQSFMQKVDMGRFVDLLFKLNNIDVSKLQSTDREKAIQQLTSGMQQPGAAGAADTEMAQVADAMNVAPQGG